MKCDASMTKYSFGQRILKWIAARRGLTVLLLCLVLFNFVLVGVVIHTAIERRFLRQIEQYVDKACEEFDVPKAVVFAIIKAESDFDQHARSSANARGLMQITSIALQDINQILSENYMPNQMFDPEINIRCGTAYLSVLCQKYEKNSTVWAAYNAGQGRVDQWLLDGRYSHDQKQLYQIPFKETRNYVKKVSLYYQEYQKQYGEN